MWVVNFLTKTFQLDDTEHLNMIAVVPHYSGNQFDKRLDDQKKSEDVTPVE